jgi:manganese transport protein
MVLLTRRADVMGGLVNRRLTTVAASAIAGLVSALNIYLIVDALTS